MDDSKTMIWAGMICIFIAALFGSGLIVTERITAVFGCLFFFILCVWCTVGVAIADLRRKVNELGKEIEDKQTWTEGNKKSQ